MRLRSLKHLLETVKAMARPKRIIVLGSSALLASKPKMGERGNPLELTFDADILIDPCDEGRASVLHEAIGEGSLFHKEYGVCADLMRPDIVETFPRGWQGRCIPPGAKVLCLSPFDLAFIKLCLGRDKDRAMLKALITAGMVTIAKLRLAYQHAELDEATMFKAGRLLHRLERECGGHEQSKRFRTSSFRKTSRKSTKKPCL
jgi:hypothetical protein